MTPKEKAKELVNRFLGLEYVLFQHDGEPFTFPQGRINLYSAKQCALIAVDEILKSEPRSPSDVDWDDVGGTHQYYYQAQREEADKYWQEVKQEIEKL
jgi:hypothetical protein